MNSEKPQDFVLLIDDEKPQLEALEAAVTAALAETGIGVTTWQPTGDDNAVERFQEFTSPPPLLVVTDYNLTANGRTGLFGSSIVALAQRRAIPVGDYSRDVGVLTDEPDVFEFRIPHDPEPAGGAIATIATGFREIATMLADPERFADDESPATLLADLLDRPAAASPFSLYSSRISVGNPALIQLLRAGQPPSNEERTRVMAYVLGHLLFNSILRFPGPVMHASALAAYVAANPSEGDAIGDMMPTALYRGPFADSGRFFWQDDVDRTLETLAKELDVPFAAGDTIDVWRRRVVERALDRAVSRHACESRCHGERGGYWCPFKLRPVCERDDCSVASSSWIPEGASLSRVEHDFFEEWAPLMGF